MNRVVIIGPPGSGKTTLAGAISGIIGLPVIRVDSLRFDSAGELVSQEKFERDTAEGSRPPVGSSRGIIVRLCRSGAGVRMW